LVVILGIKNLDIDQNCPHLLELLLNLATSDLFGVK